MFGASVMKYLDFDQMAGDAPLRHRSASSRPVLGAALGCKDKRPRPQSLATCEGAARYRPMAFSPNRTGNLPQNNVKLPALQLIALARHGRPAS
jgi:hypothetical protein